MFLAPEMAFPHILTSLDHACSVTPCSSGKSSDRDAFGPSAYNITCIFSKYCRVLSEHLLWHISHRLAFMSLSECPVRLFSILKAGLHVTATLNNDLHTVGAQEMLSNGIRVWINKDYRPPIQPCLLMGDRFTRKINHSVTIRMEDTPGTGSDLHP